MFSLLKRFRAKLVRFGRKNEPRIKVVAGILAVLALFAFGFFGTANAQNSVLVKANGTVEGASALSSGTASNASDVDYKQSESAREAVEKQICVYICGQVTAPGVYYVAQGARVCDVVECAQGFLENASLESLNLARPVSDGEQIIVRAMDEVSSDSAGSGDTSSQLVNINTATATQLEQIPGIGAAFAQRIVNYRDKQGSFKTIDELKNVSGIGDKKLESIRAYICV